MPRGSLRALPVFSVALIVAAWSGVGAFADSTSVAVTVPDTIVDSASYHAVHSGQAAPDFKLLNQQGREISLSDYSGKWVVLYFYPKDFSEGCTVEARNFQRDLRQYEAANAVILGVSVDSVGSHKDFCSKESLDFKLLADTAGAVSTLYGSLHDWFGRKKSARNTFIIDPQGTVARVFIGVQPGTHSAQVLAALAELQK